MPDHFWMKNSINIVVVVIGFTLIFFTFFQFMMNEPTLPFSLKHRAHDKTIYVDGTPVIAHLLTTEAQRVKGLSGKKSIGPNEGMLFVFDTEDEWGIWMKDMNFAIDVLWIDAQGTIVGLLPELQPDSYPQVYMSSVPSKYVLELPAGFADIYNITLGQKVDL